MRRSLTDVVRVARRLALFEVKGLVSIALLAVRHRERLPRGAVAAPYAREQTPMMLVMTFFMALETVAVDLLLVSLGVPGVVRFAVLLLDVYGVVFALALIASGVLRPHVVSSEELRVRFGEYLDVRVPRRLISSARSVRGYDEKGMVTVEGGRLGVAVSSRANVVVELAEPVTIVRPLGRRAEVTVIRFFADDPGALLAALRAPRPEAEPVTG